MGVLLVALSACASDESARRAAADVAAMHTRLESQQAPDALLRIARCHRALDDATRARTVLERVVREYPGSDAATRARTLLAGRGAARSPR